MYQQWMKRKEAEAHFVQAPVDAEIEVPLQKPIAAPENSAMDIDLGNTSGTLAKGDDDDINLDDDEIFLVMSRWICTGTLRRSIYQSSCFYIIHMSLCCLCSRENILVCNKYS
jgi:hypothetical protein